MTTQRVNLKGRGIATLRDGDYVTSGGEGSIYRLNDTVVKLYLDADKMARDGMGDKVELLARLQHPGIIAPSGVVESERSRKLLGFYMPWTEGEPLPRVFVNDFRARTGFNDSNAVSLVERMRLIVDYAHSQRAVMADANELNWIVEFPHRDGPQPRVIDVDSWAVDRWPATVMMPSIRDWSSRTIDDKSDWFAWAIVAFQVFIGIHPYKGKLDGYKPGELERRMRERKSVFAPNVRLPAAVRDLACIPGPLLDWFRAVFDGTDRTPPPSALQSGGPATLARVQRVVVSAGHGATHTKVQDAAGNPFLRTWPCGVGLRDDGSITTLDTGLTVAPAGAADAATEVVYTQGGYLVAPKPTGHHTYTVTWSDGRAIPPVSVVMKIDRFFRAANRLFAVNGDCLMELSLHGLGTGHESLTGNQINTFYAKSTQWFDGVAVVDALGAKFLFAPLEKGYAYLKVPELDALKVLDARAAGNFITLMTADKTGAYVKCEVTMQGFNRYEWWSGFSDAPDLNVAILAKGVAASVFDDGELVLYVPSSKTIKRVTDSGVLTTLRLAAWEDAQPKVVYIKDGHIWRLQAN